MLRTLHWIAFGGFACSVICTTCFIFSGVKGLTRDGRVASFSSPSTPLVVKRIYGTVGDGGSPRCSLSNYNEAHPGRRIGVQRIRGGVISLGSIGGRNFADRFVSLQLIALWQA